MNSVYIFSIRGRRSNKAASPYTPATGDIAPFAVSSITKHTIGVAAIGVAVARDFVTWQPSCSSSQSRFVSRNTALVLVIQTQDGT